MRDRGKVFTYDEVIVRKRGKLPHWHVPEGLYFVTWRLDDAMPPRSVRRIESALATRERILLAKGLDRDSIESELRHEAFRLTQPVLDAGYGSCVLRKPAAANLLTRTVEARSNLEYLMIAWCLMPNHVHTLFRLLPSADISVVVEAWKSVSSRAIANALGLRGTLWQEDYFDVLVRDERQLRTTVKYILDNPAKAGLRDWKWTFCDTEAIARLL